MFEGDDNVWWITGGDNTQSTVEALDTTELYDATTNSFTYGVDLPKEMLYHNLVNVNSTHMVVLGGADVSDEAFIFDKYLLSINSTLDK